MLPLLGQLTGRRLGLLVHLTGNDLREKYPGVWVAQTEGIVLLEGAWTRVPYKTQASTTFFVLHEFLHEIGFVEWAMSKGDGFLFPQLMGLHDPSKSASQYMRRLFERVGIESGKGEVFHSLRGGQIEDMRDAKVNGRDSRLQAGHAVGDDEHSQYGFMSLTEKRARELARLPLNPEIDYSPYRGLDFATLYQAKRTYGRRPK
jgi:integrase